MGHIRLGELPKSRRWSRVVGLLADDAADPADVAAAIVAAAARAYRDSGDDPGLIESLRVLAQLADAARHEDFVARLRAMGIAVDERWDAIGLISAVLEHAERRFGPSAQRTIFTEFALASLQEALTRTVASQTGSLFLSGMADAQLACREFSSDRGFARLAHLFFARLLARSLRYFIDHAAANQLGGDGRLASEADLRDFHAAVDRYASEAARIVEDFAGAWYSKRRWLGDVERTEGLAFVAMRKMADELAHAS